MHPLPVAPAILVPAKLNVGLAVGPRGPDGFHSIDTIFCALDLHDEVSAEPADELSLSVTGPEAATVPADRRNLAWQAAELLAERAGRPATAALRIDKRIPVAAGLAGGSADAAGALLACSRLWRLNTPLAELRELAARLGSDVSFALTGGLARGTTGRAADRADRPGAALGAGCRDRRAVHRRGVCRIRPATPDGSATAAAGRADRGGPGR